MCACARKKESRIKSIVNVMVVVMVIEKRPDSEYICSCGSTILANYIFSFLKKTKNEAPPQAMWKHENVEHLLLSRL